MRAFLFAATALTLAGCASSPAGREPSDQRTVRFVCEAGETITVVFTDGRARLTDPQGRTFELAQRPAASGVWYEGARHVLRGKGQEITWSFARMAPRTCREAG
jgi:membrane-bound inhibitor of C-type lysozyme